MVLSNVYILTAITYDTKTIVGVFATSELAIKYATLHNVPSWDIQEVTFHEDEDD